MARETPSERIVRQWREGPLEAMPPAILLETAQRLLADNERLQAREAVLVEMLQKLIRDADATYVDVHPYAGVGHTKIVGPFPSTLEQARALLVSDSADDEAK